MGPGYESAPVMVYSMIAIIGVLLVYQMPETNGVPLKQTVHEYIEDSHKDKLAKYAEKINGICQKVAFYWVYFLYKDYFLYKRHFLVNFHISVRSINNKKQYFVLQTKSAEVIYFHL